MRHYLACTASGWLVMSALGSLVLDASLFDEYGEALAELVLLTAGEM